MRLLFVSCTTNGGSGRSQRELAARLARRGHTVFFLVDDGRPARLTRWLYGHLSDLAARLEATPFAALGTWLERQPGRRCGRRSIGGIAHTTAVVPQNALARVIEEVRPDVVVGNSLDRLAWRRLHRGCAAAGIPTALYVREVDSLDHLGRGEVPDVLVANAQSLQRALVGRGHECAFVPSVIDVEVTRTISTRRVALVINPVKQAGNLVWEVAAALPDIPFVVQESWTLDAAELAAVHAHIAPLPNVELRRSVPPGPDLYGDARVLVVPYGMDSRPRVIPEAHANGIPVVAADVPALREAIGPGGVTAPLDDVEAWVGALRSLWEDEARYDSIVAAALAHSHRPEIDPDCVTAEFEALVQAALARRLA